jgi:hypothetical protein
MRSFPLLAGLLLAAGCATTPPRPPPSQTFELGFMRTSYRDYRGAEVGICQSEPRWLVDELTNANSILDRYLEQTEPAQAREWSAEQRDLAQDGTLKLPAFVETHVASLTDLERCGIAGWGMLPTLRKRGLELSQAVTARLPEVAQVLEYLDAQVVLEAWRKERSERMQVAKQMVCAGRDSARIYYAEEGPDGEARWLFCNDASVRRRPGGEPDFDAPAGLSARERRRLQSATYLRAAREFPRENVVVAPAVPSVPPALVESASTLP